MRISKNTITELLDLYLKEKEVDCETREEIIGGMFDKVDKKLNRDKEREKKERKKERKREKKRKKTRISHGTSCPRIMDNTGGLIVEF